MVGIGRLTIPLGNKPQERNGDLAAPIRSGQVFFCAIRLRYRAVTAFPTIDVTLASASAVARAALAAFF